MSFEEYPPIPDKILKPDGSVVSIINAEEIAPADAVRARIYQEMPLLAAKYLLPGGTVVNGVPITTIISGSPAEGNIIVVTADGGLQYASGGAVEVPGNDTEIMFNNAGSLGADTGFEYDKTTKKFKVHGFSVENGQIELSSIPDLQAKGIARWTANFTPPASPYDKLLPVGTTGSFLAPIIEETGAVYKLSIQIDSAEEGAVSFILAGSVLFGSFASAGSYAMYAPIYVSGADGVTASAFRGSVSAPSFRKVLTPNSTGAILTSSWGGSRGWTYKADGFDPSLALEMKVYRDSQGVEVWKS